MINNKLAILGLISKHGDRNRGGSAMTIARISNALSETPHCHIHLLTRELGSSHFLSQSINNKITYYTLKGHHRIDLIFRLLPYIIKNKIYDIVSFDTRASLLACTVKKIIPRNIRVTTCFLNALSTNIKSPFQDMRFHQKQNLKKIKKYSDTIITNSQGLGDQLSALLNVKRDTIGVIPNGIINNKFWQKANQSIEHPWLTSKELPVILGVGRLSPQKDWPTLLKAFTLLRQSMRCRLIILGEGELHDELINLSTQLGVASDVDLPGFVPNPYPWMKKASVFALSSRHEGLPHVLIEAMSLGTPAVTTDCPFGPSEIVSHLGNGLLVPVGDATAMSNALRKVLSYPPPPPSPDALKLYEATMEGISFRSWLRIS